MTMISEPIPAQATELLRFTTAGSVDDGKSTLIGRLLYDSKSVFEDAYEAIRASSEKRGEVGVNLALLTDGLKAEREQGITIDVAYRYFATPRRKFIIADTPGHIQYTRNMVTGASTANVALILIDARHGVVEQTRRHAFIASLLQIPHLVVCVNKMDLVDYEEEAFEAIRSEFSRFSQQLAVKDVQFIPISALKGDNVVTRSEHMHWYDGDTLLYYLEHVHISNDYNLQDGRFPVQYVIRPQEDAYHDYRGYAGRVASGVFRKGDPVILLPSGYTSHIAAIDSYDGELTEAAPPASVTILLEDDFDLSRGDMIVSEHQPPQVTQDIELMVCWFGDRPLQPRARYTILHTSQEVECLVKEIHYKLDINTLERQEKNVQIGMNDIASLRIRTTRPLCIDAYQRNRITGSLLFVDKQTNETVAAGMVV